MAMDSFASDSEDCARLKADRHGRSIVTVVVKEIFEVLGWGLGSFLADEFEVLAQPLPPAWVVLPRDSVPEIKEL